MATLLFPGKEFRITHQEMIKGIRRGTSGTNYRYVIERQASSKRRRFSMVFVRCRRDRVSHQLQGGGGE